MLADGIIDLCGVDTVLSGVDTVVSGGDTVVSGVDEYVCGVSSIMTADELDVCGCDSVVSGEVVSVDDVVACGDDPYYLTRFALVAGCRWLVTPWCVVVE